MSAVMDKPYLSEQEIYDLTHYHRAKEQMQKLREMGIPACRLRDNTVRVLRRDVLHPSAHTAANDGPKLKLKKR